MMGRLGCLSYVNVLPIYQGILHGAVSWSGELVCAPPQTLNRKLLEGEIHIGPVSSIEFARHQGDLVLVPPFCIASTGDVSSVTLCSRVPLGDIRSVAVPGTSATSIALLKILLSDNGLLFEAYDPGSVSDGALERADAVLRIGDPALREAALQEGYSYDLGGLWQERIGAPMVYCLWAAHRDFLEKAPEQAGEMKGILEASHYWGKSHMGEVIASASRRLGLNRQAMERYFRGLTYTLAPEIAEGLLRFFSEAASLGLCPDVRDLSPGDPHHCAV
ncbi:MAG: menaquinone biosynthesis protein [Armatimonadetes bacterium]|nr:menaquinone biosynthesis protein [Armatimonadota bacterium]